MEAIIKRAAFNKEQREKQHLKTAPLGHSHTAYGSLAQPCSGPQRS